ncbi:hypothetical protein COEREDRAFT_7575 [Coemansia reversa NRRL 1564]|uniref:Uncharacterized protein n=1 Tax=Coemansia reversa (strain ATCC 12441 / NRRL 1564) TaxID=763665 RepID=A0A2G5BDX1_COERN|nr:hypothetical protein COEREDRAFT_7575 [Coemansia reversa NRRL 1564]|eukprot:PIA17214.1 hypothetical protein COEREDRAFT_7575 [Coemansia reversa NRRL 1564]
MAKSTLKGADALIIQRRPMLRVAAYAMIGLMSLVNMAMLSSSWSSTRFMRDYGAFTGTFVVTSSIVTIVVSGILATATFLCIRAEKQDVASPKFSERLTSDSIERAVCCLMTTWWLSMALSLSNMAFVFRDEINKCVHHKLTRHYLKGVSADTAALGCEVFRGSLVLCWMIWTMWVVRLWRTFTRSNMHFDSSIFQEPNESVLDISSIKPVTAILVNPETFSPRNPDAYQTAKNGTDTDNETVSSNQTRSTAPQTEACHCADCPLSRVNVLHQTRGQGKMGQGLATYRVRSKVEGGYPQMSSRIHTSPTSAHPVPQTDTCCQCPPVIGTATLVTEPI